MLIRIAVLLTVCIALSATPLYNVSLVGPVGQGTVTGWAINDDGAVAGWSRTPGQPDQAFTDSGSGAQTLSVGAQASGIGSTGQVVGTTYSANGPRATVWGAAEATYLDGLGGTASYASGINAAGEIAGTFAGSGGNSHGFLASAGQIRDLGAFAGGTSIANALNDSGQVTGYSNLANGSFHAFLWSSDSGLRDIGTLGGSQSYGLALSGNGDVVGSSTTPGGYLHAFLYDGMMRDLGTLGGTSSGAYGINGDGQIVGFSYDTAGSSRAFLWRSGYMFDLNDFLPSDSGWFLESAYGINSSGQIVGTGVYAGQKAAFRLDPAVYSLRSAQLVGDSPVPEPGTAGLLLAAGTVLAYLSRNGRRNRNPL